MSVFIYSTSIFPSNYLAALKVQGSNCYSNLDTSELEPYSEPCQTSKIERFVKYCNIA